MLESLEQDTIASPPQISSSQFIANKQMNNHQSSNTKQGQKSFIMRADQEVLIANLPVTQRRLVDASQRKQLK